MYKIDKHFAKRNLESNLIKTDILIIGGGPAGITAAIEAGKLGANVILMDDNLDLGGQLIKQTHQFFGSEKHYAGTRGIDIARILFKQLDELDNVTVMNFTTASGIFDDGIVGYVQQRTKFGQIDAKKIIIATGAKENMLKFPGNDLPGVYGAGAVQTLMNLYGVRPGKSALMIGAGNIGLIVSYQMLQAGMEIKGIVEAAATFGGYQVHASKIQRLGVPLLLRHTILEAIGDEEVRGALIAKVDDNWQPIPGSEREIICDMICLAVGLSPLSEVLYQTGCEMHYVPELGGNVPKLNHKILQTSNPKIHVAGDVSGIEEASSAMVEGKIAGTCAAMELGYTNKSVRANLDDFYGQLNQLREGYFGNKIRWGMAKLDGTEPPEEVEDVRSKYVYPETVLFKKAAMPIMECDQKIPCNPCSTVCPVGAIKVEDQITNTPELDYDACINCGKCVTNCPGLAVFMIDDSVFDDHSLISIPYELLPLPEVGEKVYGLNRGGEMVCYAEVHKTRTSKKKVSMVTLKVPREHAMDVRSFQKIVRKGVIVCRCEDISEQEIIDAIDSGLRSFNELKKFFRVGMGPCQGNTCHRLTLQILSRKLGIPIEELERGKVRPPMKPVKMGVLASTENL